MPLWYYNCFPIIFSPPVLLHCEWREFCKFNECLAIISIQLTKFTVILWESQLWTWPVTIFLASIWYILLQILLNNNNNNKRTGSYLTRFFKLVSTQDGVGSSHELWVESQGEFFTLSFIMVEVTQTNDSGEFYCKIAVLRWKEVNNAFDPEWRNKPFYIEKLQYT